MRAPPAYDFIVSLYPKGARVPSDCLPEYFGTRSEAREAAEKEIRRVAAISEAERIRQIDWAYRYTIRKVYRPQYLND